MPSEDMAVGNYRKERKRTERIQKSELETLSVPLSVGGSMTISFLEDVEEYVGRINRNNDFKVEDRDDYYRVVVYREKKICTVEKCGSTAEQKFDGNWLCPQHLDSYTAKHI